MNKVTETPDKWTLILIDNSLHKVYATKADSWRLNSGIKEVKQDKDYFYLYGYSGSCYKCHKEAYGTASLYLKMTLHGIVDKSEGRIQILTEKEAVDWIKDQI